MGHITPKFIIDYYHETFIISIHPSVNKKTLSQKFNFCKSLLKNRQPVYLLLFRCVVVVVRQVLFRSTFTSTCGLCCQNCYRCENCCILLLRLCWFSRRYEPSFKQGPVSGFRFLFSTVVGVERPQPRGPLSTNYVRTRRIPYRKDKKTSLFVRTGSTPNTPKMSNDTSSSNGLVEGTFERIPLPFEESFISRKEMTGEVDVTL